MKDSPNNYFYLKFISKEDLENNELKLLPIRRGCIGFCGCTGVCREIVGHIEREEYEEFARNSLFLSEFLESKCKNK